MLRQPLSAKWGEAVAGYSGQVSDALRVQAQAVGLVSPPPPPPVRNPRLGRFDTIIAPDSVCPPQPARRGARLVSMDTLIDPPAKQGARLVSMDTVIDPPLFAER